MPSLPVSFDSCSFKVALTTAPALPVMLVSVLVAFAFRIVAVREHWGQLVPYKAPCAGPGVRAA